MLWVFQKSPMLQKLCIQWRCTVSWKVKYSRIGCFPDWSRIFNFPLLTEVLNFKTEYRCRPEYLLKKPFNFQCLSVFSFTSGRFIIPNFLCRSLARLTLQSKTVWAYIVWNLFKLYLCNCNKNNWKLHR